MNQTLCQNYTSTKHRSMSRHKTIRRLTLEIEKIEKGHYPSFKEIHNFLLEHDFDLSDRTIQRDISRIRTEFGIEIGYDRGRDGYFIDREQSLNVPSFFRFLEIVSTAELLTESLLESKDTLRYVSFDTGGGLEGIEHLKPILKAIKHHRKISFDHYNFHTEKSRKYHLRPYLLKEYQNRWYVVGMARGITELRTFGLDRIQNLKVKAETFTPDKKLEPIENFEQIIGLVYSENNVQKIVLSFTPTQGKYIKTLPLHRSQEILMDNEHECRVSLHIRPNYELTQQILKHGDSVKVLEPKWLVEEVKGILGRSLEGY